MSVRVAILTNMISPYRVPIYEAIGRRFETWLFYSGREDNRTTWDGVPYQLHGVRVKRSWGLVMRRVEGRNGKVRDLCYTHVTPGYLWDLIHVKPDAVITTEMGFRTLMALLYGSVFRKPIWVWWGGTSHTERDIGHFRKVLRWVISRWSRRWISYGETSTEYLLTLGIPRECILQIQNCVNEHLYREAIQPLFHVEPRPVLLYVGQLIGRKGIDLLLDAAARVQARGFRFSLVVVGSGPEKRSLEEKAMNLGLNHIHFFPPQRPAAMPAVYRSADCLVFPTLEDVWGLVVNEALWSGLPVLSSIYAGCTQEIVPKPNWFDPLDPADFDRALIAALEGRLAPPDTKKLKTCQEVVDMIINDIIKSISRPNVSA